MIRKELEDHRKNKQDLLILEMEIKMILRTDYGLGNDVIFDYTNGYARPVSIIGFDRKRYESKLKKLEEKKAKIDSVENWISEIPDDTTRIVFMMYYIEGKQWLDIANGIGYYGKEYYPRKYIRDKYLKEIGIN